MKRRPHCCEVCGRKLEVRGKGRPRRTCRASCRQRASRDRRRVSAGSTSGENSPEWAGKAFRDTNAPRYAFRPPTTKGVQFLLTGGPCPAEWQELPGGWWECRRCGTGVHLPEARPAPCRCDR